MEKKVKSNIGSVSDPIFSYALFLDALNYNFLIDEHLDRKQQFGNFVEEYWKYIEKI